ncbi:hypothetical protein CK203_100303 [Vitis vinifera]|uniref:Uncharacterized protein n=1 Tax=Vitis vinifera TaxID=29760 RepID=A0A438D3A4_VITVI|nr:hypothetical protein CK203_100303 [Vitis vinifera]
MFGGNRSDSSGVRSQCVVVLLLTLSVFVCALFWALPLRSVKTEFDAKDSIKLGGLNLGRTTSMGLGLDAEYVLFGQFSVFHQQH